MVAASSIHPVFCHRKRCCDVLLLEASGGLGGWMRSKREAGGAVFELGPRSIRTAGHSGKATLAVVRAGITDFYRQFYVYPIVSIDFCYCPCIAFSKR